MKHLQKIQNWDIIADLGTRTLHSPTGFATLEENIHTAVQRGLEYLAITDYFKAESGQDTAIITERMHMTSLLRVRDPRITLIPGVEFDLGLDLHSVGGGNLPTMPWTTASDYKVLTNTRGLTQMRERIELRVRNGLKALAHPEQSLAYLSGTETSAELSNIEKEFYDWLVYFCKKEKVYLGVSELSTRTERTSTAQKYWLRYAAQNDNPLFLASDAAHSIDVGDFTNVTAMIIDMNIRMSNILNCDKDTLNMMFGRGFNE